MNNRFHLLLFLSFLFAISLTHANAQVDLSCGDNLEITSLTSEDVLITSELGSITIELRGGDGGDVKLDGSICGNKTIEGGSGATMKATFSVGTGTGELEPGGKLRVFAGRAGERIRKICSNGGNHNGGGGGSSAVLYLAPGKTRWHLLAVAGGGGGANRQSAGITNEGRGANSDENGDSLPGDANGGSEDGCAESNIVPSLKRGYAGGGYKCSFPDIPKRGGSMAINFGFFNPIQVGLKDNSEAALTGGREGEDTNGGNGFTGGGGGGGGFYGGAASSIRAGGGGGSFISSWHNPSNTSKTAGSRGGGSQSDGWVKISGTTNAEASCVNNFVVSLDASGMGSVSSNEIDNGSTLPCETATYMTLLNESNGQEGPSLTLDCSDLGAVSVRLKIYDANDELLDACTTTIAAEDNIAPTVSCGTAIRALDENGQHRLNPFTLFNGSDNCGIASQTVLDNGLPLPISPLNFNCSHLGNNIFEAVVSDGNNNAASCTFVVVVLDNLPPTANCKDITATLDENEQAIVDAAEADDGSADNCDIPDFLFMDGNETVNSLTFDCSSAGVNTRTVLVKDQKNNTAECSVNITVVNNTAPIITCPADIVVDNDPGGCSAVVDYSAPAGADNCSGLIAELTNGLGAGAAFPIGTTEETYQVTDAAGRSASCSFTITVNDTEAPTFSLCSKGIVVTVDNDPNQCSAVATYTSPRAFDNCILGVNIVQTGGLGSGSAFPVGTTTETYTATDASGNTANCSFTITVNDVEAPQIDCPRVVVVDNDPNQCSAVATYISPRAFDNCTGGINIVQTGGLGSGSTFPVGTTTETYTATDASGNTANCSFKVYVNDVESPQIDCPADIVVNSPQDACGARVNYDLPAATDNCELILIRTRGLGRRSLFPVGVTTETRSYKELGGWKDIL